MALAGVDLFLCKETLTVTQSPQNHIDARSSYEERDFCLQSNENKLHQLFVKRFDEIRCFSNRKERQEKTILIDIFDGNGNGIYLPAQ